MVFRILAIQFGNGRLLTASLRAFGRESLPHDLTI
jgi:hypothetical protein